MSNVRKTTNKLLDLVEEGVWDPKAVVKMCLSYMSEADVADMCQSNDLFQDEDEEEEEEDPGCGEDCCGASCICHAR